MVMADSVEVYPWGSVVAGRLRAVLRRLGVSRAVFFSILTQAWSVLVAPATMIVITHWLSPVQQGFYYTFSSILALQLFVELGLVRVIVQVAAYEWAFLGRGPRGAIEGDPRALSRLASLLRFAVKWYAVCGLLVMVVLNVGGAFFLSTRPVAGVDWRAPWVCLCVVAGLAMMMSPLFSLIEGCNYVASICAFRFVQGIVSSLAIVVSIILGAALFALPIAALTRFLCGVAFIGSRHWSFIRQVVTTRISEPIRWLAEVWPFQWRMAVSCLSGYFIFSLFTPVMFYYHGAEVAGQMGMTWTLVSGIETVSLAWVSTRLPEWGMLIARRQFVRLDRAFAKTTIIALTVAGTGLLCLGAAVFWLRSYHFALGARVLPVLPLALLSVQKMMNIPINTMAWYLRAHKREPMMLPSLIGGILVGLSTWLLGARYGPTGAAAGYVILTISFGLPTAVAVFVWCKSAWHSEPGGA